MSLPWIRSSPSWATMRNGATVTVSLPVRSSRARCGSFRRTSTVAATTGTARSAKRAVSPRQRVRFMTTSLRRFDYLRGGAAGGGSLPSAGGAGGASAGGASAGGGLGGGSAGGGWSGGASPGAVTSGISGVPGVAAVPAASPAGGEPAAGCRGRKLW